MAKHLRKAWEGASGSPLQDAQMVDNKLCVEMTIDERSARVQIVPAQHVDPKVVMNLHPHKLHSGPSVQGMLARR